MSRKGNFKLLVFREDLRLTGSDDAVKGFIPIKASRELKSTGDALRYLREHPDAAASGSSIAIVDLKDVVQIQTVTPKPKTIITSSKEKQPRKPRAKKQAAAPAPAPAAPPAESGKGDGNIL